MYCLYSFLSKQNFMVHALENERTQTHSLSGCWCCKKPLWFDYTTVLWKYHRMPFKNQTNLKVPSQYRDIIRITLAMPYKYVNCSIFWCGVIVKYWRQIYIDNVGSKVNKHTSGLCSIQSLRMPIHLISNVDFELQFWGKWNWFVQCKLIVHSI